MLTEANREGVLTAVTGGGAGGMTAGIAGGMAGTAAGIATVVGARTVAGTDEATGNSKV